jgi:hypothetical protein
MNTTRGDFEDAIRKDYEQSATLLARKDDGYADSVIDKLWDYFLRGCSTHNRLAKVVELQPPCTNEFVADGCEKFNEYATYDVVVQIGADTVQFSAEMIHAQIINGKHCLQVKVPVANIDSYRNVSSPQPSLSTE